MVNDKRFQLINMPRTYLDLSTTQSAQLLTDDLKHITDALNTLILGDETYYNQQIADLSNQVSSLTSSSTATAPGTIPIGTFTDFTDSRYWQYYPSYWFSVVPTSTDVTITSRNSVGITNASLGILGGMMFRPRVIPDENDEMEIRLKMIPVTTLSSSAFLGCNFGLARIAYSQGVGGTPFDLFHIGLDGSVIPAYNIRLEEYAFTSIENPTITNYIKELVLTVTSAELKLTMQRGDPSNASTFHLISQQINVNNAGFSTFSYGGSPPLLANRRSFLIPTYRFGVFACGLKVQNGMSVKLADFHVVKGIILNETNIVL